MKASSWACAAVLAGAVAGLALSVRHVATAKTRGPVREYTFACWGAAKETNQLQELVIDPINSGAGDFRVKLVPIPSDYDTKLCTMIAGGTPPDLFYLSQEYLPAFALQGALLDLTERIERDTDEVTDLSSYYQSVLRLYRHRGRLYGLPWIAQPVILYCNVKLFRQAGVGLPDGEWDWDRFVRAAGKLTRDTDGDGRTDQWGFILNGWPPYLIWVWQNGADIVDANTNRLSLRGPRVSEALDFYAGLIHKHRVAPPLSIVSEMGFSELFRSGKVAMFMGGAADDLDRIEGLEVVTAEIPAGPEGVRSTFAWTAGLCIARSVPDPDEAFEIWKRILDGIQRWKIPSPRRPLAAQLEQFAPRKAPAADVIRRSMEYMRAPVIFERQIEWDSLFWEEFEERLLRTGKPARQLLGQAEKVLKELL